MYTKEQVTKWLLEEQNRLTGLGIPVSSGICPEIRFSKATSWYGQCRQNCIYQGVKYRFRISISEYHLQSSERAIRNTLIHELLHTCPGCLNHGPKWRAYADQVRQQLGYNIIASGGDKDKASAMEAARQAKRAGYQTKYLLVCTRCGQEITRFRRSNLVLHPEKYRCKCGGKIKHKR
ncbi:MAG: SprT-like domain-containing protein [Firmicutes bacterium]|nr:SprT-like domain-containing protein [Bacillota bacterium]